MSKSRGNTVDPWTVLDAWGADALRWYLQVSGPAEQNKNFDVAGVELAARGYLATLWSSYSFFLTYARIDEPNLREAPPRSDRPLIDQWLLAKCDSVIQEVTSSMAAYQGGLAARALASFVVEDLSNWYLRLNRRRFWKNDDPQDQASAYATVHECLLNMCRLSAPITPFITEKIWRNLRQADPTLAESVHLARWPQAQVSPDSGILADLAATRTVVEMGRSARAQATMRTRQPLKRVLIQAPDEVAEAGVLRFSDLVTAELNVKSVEIVPRGSSLVTHQLRPNLKTLGRRLGSRLASLRAHLASADQDAWARDLQGGKSLTLDLDGEPETFTLEDFLVDAEGLPGFALIVDGGWLVALDTQLTPELHREGLIRDLIRVVQQARKDAELDVSDRITVSVHGNAEVLDAVAWGQNTIAAETLALTVTTVDVTLHKYQATGKAGQHEVSIGLTKA